MVENHRFCCDITQILSVVLRFFQQNIGLRYNSDSCFQYNTKTQTSTMDFMFIVWCEFFVVLDYDKMNCNLVYEVFYNVF